MIKFIALGGFLGAGKTTTLVAAARMLEQQGRRVAVVTNDQGTELVDTALVRSELASVAEVTGGCFCCRFEDLMTVVAELIANGSTDTIIAEAVGSCTDLQATVVRPIRAFHGEQFSVAPLTTVVDPHRLRAFGRAAARGEPESELSYLFGRQLAEADVIAVNKIDLIGADQAGQALAGLRERYPSATVLPYSARTGDGLAALVTAWQAEAARADDLDVDYDRYAAAEAQLAWLNQRFDLQPADESGFAPAAWTREVLSKLAEFASAQGDLGHVKLVVDTSDGITKMSMTTATAQPSVDAAVETTVQGGTAVLNARVACAPAALDAAALDAVAHADRVTAVTSRTSPGPKAIRPGYPVPVHRLAAAQS